MPVYEIKDQATKFKDLEAGDIFYIDSDTSETFLKTCEDLKDGDGGGGNCIFMQSGGLYWIQDDQSVVKFNKVTLT